jgi:hypothetical protein
VAVPGRRCVGDTAGAGGRLAVTGTGGLVAVTGTGGLLAVTGTGGLRREGLPAPGAAPDPVAPASRGTLAVGA